MKVVPKEVSIPSVKSSKGLKTQHKLSSFLQDDFNRFKVSYKRAKLSRALHDCEHPTQMHDNIVTPDVITKLKMSNGFKVPKPKNYIDSFNNFDL